jgi:hypothetical protein
VKQRTALDAKKGSVWPKSQKVLAYGEEHLAKATAAGFRSL